MKIKIHDPVIHEQERSAIKEVINSHILAIADGSKRVTELEKKFKEYVQADECVAVDSGSAALHLSLSVLDIKNKEVILPSFGHVSIAHAIIQNGGKPIFVDINKDTLCIDELSIKKLISRNTKVIIPVHFGGMPSNLKEIMGICKDSSLNLVEDAALATGSTYYDKKIGSHGNFVCFSLHPVKIISAPKGGLITLNGKNSTRFKKILNAKRNCGIYDKKNYCVNQIGWNYYMNEFSAAMGLAQLKKIENMITKRKYAAKRYNKEINSDLKMPYDENCSYNFYWIIVKNQKNFIKNMHKNGIEVVNYHKPIHQLEFYKSKTKLPNTEWITKHLVLFPTHPNLKPNEIDKIVKYANQFL